MTKRHELKTWPKYFAAIRDGTKNFEIRLNDRDFALGDIVVLKEFDPGSEAYTGQVEERQITFLLSEEEFGVAHTHVAIGFGPIGAGRPTPAAPGMGVGELKDWHSRMAADATLRAANACATADGMAHKPQLAANARRYRDMAATAEDEAGRHAAAAELIDRLASGIGEAA